VKTETVNNSDRTPRVARIKARGFRASAWFLGTAAVLMLARDASSAAIGYGSKATGGAGGREVVVTTAEALKAACESAEPMIIRVKGAIVHDVSGGDDNARIFVKSNKTIEGIGTDASVDANFNAVGVDNVIFRNLTIMNPNGKGTEDGIEFTKGCTNIWVDHCTFKQCLDGALDIKKGSDFVTVSWCKFDYTSATHDHNFANLIGHDDKETGDRGKLHVTMHHNWYANNVIERMPRVRYGTVHVFNNYYSSNRTHYNIGVGVESQILIEASYFQNQGDSTWFNWYEPNKCTEACAPGRIHWTADNIFAGTTRASTWAPNSTVFTPPYEYRAYLDNASDVPRIVSAGAGAGVTAGAVSIGDPSAHRRARIAAISSIRTTRTGLEFDLSEGANLDVAILDVAGRQVAIAMHGHQSPGSHSIDLDAYGLGNGVYYAEIQAGPERQRLRILKS